MNRMISNSRQRAIPAQNMQGLEEIAAAAVAFDWETGDLKHLGRMMSKLGLDLATAMRVFLNGRPHDLNYMDPEDVPLEQRARFSMLDSLHGRINCGFYLPDPQRGLGAVRAEAEAWFDAQHRDHARGKSGRWVFDKKRFEAISDDGPRTLIQTPTTDSRPTLLRVLTEPFWQ